jgi:hypothetical protein
MTDSCQIVKQVSQSQLEDDVEILCHKPRFRKYKYCHWFRLLRVVHHYSQQTKQLQNYYSNSLPPQNTQNSNKDQPSRPTTTNYHKSVYSTSTQVYLQIHSNTRNSTKTNQLKCVFPLEEAAAAVVTVAAAEEA